MATQADFDRMSNWAVMLNPDENIDRHHCRRVVPMEVLSLGFSRTATLSMREALMILGYPDPYHYSKIFANVKDADMWQEAFDCKFRGKTQLDWRQHFDKLLGHCGAVTDTPSVTFWAELLNAYPDAKVVLIERDEDKWHASYSLLIEGILNPVARYVLRSTDPFWLGRISNLGTAGIEAFTGTRNLEHVKKNARAAYRRHYANIRATVPKERLLEYELGSGWESLCKFLGKDIPNAPFPKRNEAAVLQFAFGTFIGKALKNSLFNVAIVVGVGASVGGAAWRFL